VQVRICSPFYGQLGTQNFDRELVPAHDLFPKAGRLTKDKACVDGQDSNFVGQLRDHVDQSHPLATTERRRESQLIAVSVDGPLDHLARVRPI
jgi:hypothetical protein